jgi:hypothetical protein
MVATMTTNGDLDRTSQPPSVTEFATKRQERAQELTEKVDEAIERLAGQLSQGHTVEFLATLAFFARFHRYSFNNSILIQHQCPDASLVAGLRRWNELGYRVRAGERAIWVWAPIVKKEPDEQTGEDQEVVVGFRPAPVFDASQLANTADKPLPDLFRPLPDDVSDLYDATKARIETTGIEVRECDLPHGVLGLSEGGRIRIRSRLGSRVRFFVLLHELTHELAHRGEEQRAKSRELKEFEAEVTAYVAAAAIGLQNPSSADYVLTYNGTAEILRASLGTISRLVREVLRVVGEISPVERRAA